MKFSSLFKPHPNHQRGVSIFFAIMILSVILSLALGTSIILIRQIKIMRGISHSVITFYAADTGIENVLYVDKLCYSPNCSTSSPPLFCTPDCTGLPDNYTTSTVLENGARYDVEFSTSTDGTVVIKSVGSYKGKGRAIQVIR